MKNNRLTKVFFIMVSTLFLLVGCSESVKSSIDAALVSTVKEGSLYEYPDKTVGKAFDDFFVDPKWEYFLSTEDEHVVEFNGVAEYYGEDAMITIQFIIDEVTEEFEIYWFGVDDVEESDYVLFDLLDTVYYE
ncbi:hypothetical protein GCM10008967_35880 [Bacillus carboniphilus]|uniref:Lipoprotein n=1 Tax=Bacillus carboniphilus TaxID=86663 RepID=A0ABN0WNJ4_9BACI